MKWRRATFVFLCFATAIGAFSVMAYLLSRNGLSWLDYVMLTCFAITLPWNVIGFWNAFIGLAILHIKRDPSGYICPPLRKIDTQSDIQTKTAILAPVHNEDPVRVFRHLNATMQSLQQTGQADAFEVFILSDSSDSEVIALEERLFAEWRANADHPMRLHYRRRDKNTDYKTGNIWEFLDRHGKDFDYCLPLDADSLMSGDAIVRLTRTMDADPSLGICQSLIIGLPASSGFTRIFQFGMRHAMRSYATGAAWWQDNACPYWGHNAVIRTEAFMQHGRLDYLPGKPPLGGLIMSHDQVEAAQLYSAGYAVRVVPDEFGSFEENPPTLPDYSQRDLRWCLGNMQYFALLARPNKLKTMGRVLLMLAILMYLAAPAWILFMLCGVVHLSLTSMGFQLDGAGEWTSAMATLSLGLFGMVMTMNFAPKIAGIIDVLLRSETRKAYGGTPRILISAFIELLFSMLLAPVVTVSQTVFMGGLLFGKTIVWNSQARDSRQVAWGEAFRSLWPQVTLGLFFFVIFLALAPQVLPWASPVITGLLLAPVFAWGTTHPAFGRMLRRLGLCALPEEFVMPDEVKAAGFRKLVPETSPQSDVKAAGLVEGRTQA